MYCTYLVSNVKKLLHRQYRLLRSIAFFSLIWPKYGKLTHSMRRPSGVVVRVRNCRILHLGLICAECAWQVLRLGGFRVCSFILFLQNLALELGFGQWCQLEKQKTQVQKETTGAAAFSCWKPSRCPRHCLFSYIVNISLNQKNVGRL